MEIIILPVTPLTRISSLSTITTKLVLATHQSQSTYQECIASCYVHNFLIQDTISANMANRMNHDSIARAIQAHQDDIARKLQEIEMHKQQIAQLTRDFNALPALLPELLHIIFMKCVRPEPSSGDECSGQKDTVNKSRCPEQNDCRSPHWQWLVLSQVCSAWRFAALSHPLHAP